jgi:hypothetical protein
MAAVVALLALPLVALVVLVAVLVGVQVARQQQVKVLLVLLTQAGFLATFILLVLVVEQAVQELRTPYLAELEVVAQDWLQV